MRLSLTEACAVVQRGGVLIYPTETLWGLGGDAAVPAVFARVLRAKGIVSPRPVPVLASSLAEVRGIVAGPVPGLDRLAEACWPGALTLALPVADRRLRHLAAADGTVGLRISREPIATALAAAAGGFLISTSANATGSPPPHTLRELDPAVLAATDGVVDAAVGGRGKPSSLLAFVAPHRWRLVRAGAIELTRLQEILGPAHEIASEDGP